MGGHPGGEVASALAIEAVQEAGTETLSSAPEEWIRSLFREASRRIEARGRREPQHREMGTTLTVLTIRRGLAWAGHIGDTRLYWIRGEKMAQITNDHTMAQDLVDAGLLNPNAADGHPASHVLTRCLGTCPDQSPDLLVTPLILEAGDRLLLASDGLVKAVRPTRLPALLDGTDAGGGARVLVETTLNGGAPDNVTVVVIVVLDPGPRDAHAAGVPFSEAAEIRWTRG
jgi:protein phosphatase